MSSNDENVCLIMCCFSKVYWLAAHMTDLLEKGLLF